MAKVQSTVIVARPVEAAYRHFLELDKHPSEPEVESVIKQPEGPTGPGTMFTFRHRRGSKVTETWMRFTSLEPNRSIVFEGDIGPVRPKGAFTFGQTDGATTLSVRIDDLNPCRPTEAARSSSRPHGSANQGPETGARQDPAGSLALPALARTGSPRRRG